MEILPSRSDSSTIPVSSYSLKILDKVRAKMSFASFKSSLRSKSGPFALFVANFFIASRTSFSVNFSDSAEIAIFSGSFFYT